MKCFLSLEGFNGSSECIPTLEFNALSRGVGILERSEYGYVAMWQCGVRYFRTKIYLRKSVSRNRGFKSGTIRKKLFQNIYTLKTSINCCLTHSCPGFKLASSHTCHMTESPRQLLIGPFLSHNRAVWLTKPTEIIFDLNSVPAEIFNSILYDEVNKTPKCLVKFQTSRTYVQSAHARLRRWNHVSGCSLTISLVHRDCQTQGCFLYVIHPERSRRMYWRNLDYEGGIVQGKGVLREERLMRNSCPHKAQQEVLPNQVQDPLPTSPLHSCLEGCREGREVEAIPTTQYVFPSATNLHGWERCKTFQDEERGSTRDCI